jgi:hypothetical protein
LCLLEVVDGPMLSMGGRGRAERVWALIAGQAAADGGAVSVARVCGACVRATGTDGGVLALATSSDRRAVAHATDEVAAGLDDLQFSVGEGPCVDAFAGGRPVLVGEVGSAEAAARWPVYAPAAWAAGAGAVFAFPLQVGAIRVGTLEMYRAAAGSLSGEQLSDALAFCDAALSVVLTATHPPPLPGTGGVDGGQGHLSFDGPVDGLGEGRAQVYQATGMVAVQLGSGLGEALVRLRARAFTSGLPLAEVARLVVDRTLRFSPDHGSG